MPRSRIALEAPMCVIGPRASPFIRSLRANNFQALRELFSIIYFGSAEPLMKTIGNDFDHYFSQAVAQSRRAIRETIGDSSAFEIALPQRHGGKTLISHADNGGQVIIDSSLL